MPATTAAARPLFIGGCPRSGTTLLGSLLGVGPDVLTVPEAVFKWPLMRELGPAGDLDVAATRDRLAAEWQFPAWQSPPPSGTGRLGYAELFDDLVSGYGAATGKPEPRIWVDHTPGNIRWVSTLHRCFPEARFIHLVRDGRAVFASVRDLGWGPNTAAQAAAWWATHIALGTTAAASGAPVLQVRYEDLVTDPVATLADIAAWAELPIDPEQAAAGGDYNVPGYTRHQHELVGGMPDPARINAWRSRLDAREVETFEHATFELLAYLGYDLDHGVAATPAPRADRLKDAASDLARRVSSDRLRRRAERRAGFSDGADPIAERDGAWT